MRKPREFAQTARELAETVIAERNSSLSDAGLRLTVDLKHWSEPSWKDFELEVALWRDNALVGFFEDFVVKNGSPVASLTELRKWLEEGIDEIIQESQWQ